MICGRAFEIVGDEAKYCPYCGSTLSDETRIYALPDRSVGGKVVVNNHKLLRGLYYSKDHLWIELESGKAKVGITDYAQKQLREIVYVELPSTYAMIKQFEPFGTVESVKAVSDLVAPLSGMVEKTNEQCQNRPELLNEDPYGKGWLMVISPSNVRDELDELMDFDTAMQWYRQLPQYT